LEWRGATAGTWLEPQCLRVEACVWLTQGVSFSRRQCRNGPSRLRCWLRQL